MKPVGDTGFCVNWREAMEKWIHSQDNPIFKRLTRLKQKKFRDREGEYIIEGPNLVEEALKNGGRLRLAAVSGWPETGELAELTGKLKLRQIPTVFLPPGLFEQAGDTQHSQGILAVAEKNRLSPEGFFQARRPGGNVILLDRLQDPGNLGTILRTADAAGFLGAILIKGCGDIYSPKVVRAAAGSLFRLPVLFVESGEEAADLVKKHEKTLICTTLDCKNSYDESMMERDVALVIGNEGNGVSGLLMEAADFCVSIPMAGTVESLNAGVAAGILMYEAVRQQKNALQSRT